MPIMNNTDTLAGILDHASLHAATIAPLSRQHELTVADAYHIQQASIARRVARGERIVGIKMGFTSEAKMNQMGVHDQIYGYLTDAMQIKNGASISLGHYIHPRCEPELAFLLKHPLQPDATEQQVLDAIEAIAPAIEIIDSRYEAFQFSLTDVIADNASSSGFVIDGWSRFPGDFSDLQVTLTLNGQIRQWGSTSAILGNPLRSLMAAARLTAQAGITLQAGWIVLAGAATSAEELKAGMKVDAYIDSLGSVKFSVSGTA
jgi:2-oxo-3-hexenedioate decarboxylase